MMQKDTMKPDWRRWTFKKKSEAARVDINTWVEKKTQGEKQHELIII